jgi:hypothetical protein
LSLPKKKNTQVFSLNRRQCQLRRLKLHLNTQQRRAGMKLRKRRKRMFPRMSNLLETNWSQISTNNLRKKKSKMKEMKRRRRSQLKMNRPSKESRLRKHLPQERPQRDHPELIEEEVAITPEDVEVTREEPTKEEKEALTGQEESTEEVVEASTAVVEEITGLEVVTTIRLKQLKVETKNLSKWIEEEAEVDMIEDRTKRADTGSLTTQEINKKAITEHPTKRETTLPEKNKKINQSSRKIWPLVDSKLSLRDQRKSQNQVSHQDREEVPGLLKAPPAEALDLEGIIEEVIGPTEAIEAIAEVTKEAVKQHNNKNNSQLRSSDLIKQLDNRLNNTLY